MKTLILENDPPDLVPEQTKRIANEVFPEHEVWGWFRRDMHTKKEESVARLMALKTGDNLLLVAVLFGIQVFEPWAAERTHAK